MQDIYSLLILFPVVWGAYLPNPFSIILTYNTTEQNTLWFYGWLTLAIIFIARAVYKWYLLELVKQRELLAQKVTERTAALQAREDEVYKQHQLLAQKQAEIETQNSQLQKLNETLEEKVYQRTAQLQKALDKVLHSTRELDNFIYKAPHDFRGPIARLLGLVKLAKFDLSSTDTTLDYLNKIEHTASKMDVMLGKLMKVYELERLKLALTPIDVEQLIATVITQLRSYINTSHCEFLIENELSGLLHTDEKCLEVILMNLLDNALVYSSKSQPPVQIHIIITETDNGAKLVISDNGMGISPDIQAYVLEPFFKGTNFSEGNGLGLYLVQKAVDKLEGELSFTSAVHQQTIFTVELPWQEESIKY